MSECKGSKSNSVLVSLIYHCYCYDCNCNYDERVMLLIVHAYNYKGIK